MSFSDLEVRDILMGWRTGRLVDREAIDYEAAIEPLRNWIEFMLATAPLEGSDAEWWDRNLLIGATLTVDAAIGEA